MAPGVGLGAAGPASHGLELAGIQGDAEALRTSPLVFLMLAALMMFALCILNVIVACRAIFAWDEGANAKLRRNAGSSDNGRGAVGRIIWKTVGSIALRAKGAGLYLLRALGRPGERFADWADDVRRAYNALCPNDQKKVVGLAFFLVEVGSQGLALFERTVGPRALSVDLWTGMIVVVCINVIVAPLALAFARDYRVELCADFACDLLFLAMNLRIAMRRGTQILGGALSGMGGIPQWQVATAELGIGFCATTSFLAVFNLLNPAFVMTWKLRSVLKHALDADAPATEEVVGEMQKKPAAQRVRSRTMTVARQASVNVKQALRTALRTANGDDEDPSLEGALANGASLPPLWLRRAALAVSGSAMLGLVATLAGLQGELATCESEWTQPGYELCSEVHVWPSCECRAVVVAEDDVLDEDSIAALTNVGSVQRFVAAGNEGVLAEGQLELLVNALAQRNGATLTNINLAGCNVFGECKVRYS